eukprot:TRINITY_DN2125_c2_g1_i1.p1 TRINITY_DN2125_c2_g1~~TRINITY_DN2125_c2_g1_i1.p1  ORF type:complete len:514 (+),score=67.33 TRINITY_DN2125_c2_g1_i1:44-1585(+)
MVFGLGKKKDKGDASSQKMTDQQQQQQQQPSSDHLADEAQKDRRESVMSPEALRTYMERFYLYKATTPDGNSAYGDFSKLDKIDGVINTGKNPDIVIKTLISLYGEGPPHGWVPPQYGKLSKTEAKDAVISLYEKYGQSADTEQLDKKLDMIYKQSRPYEYLVNVTTTLLDDMSAKAEAEGKPLQPKQVVNKPSVPTRLSVSHLDDKHVVPGPRTPPLPPPQDIDQPDPIPSGKFHSVATSEPAVSSGSARLTPSAVESHRSKLASSVHKAEKQLSPKHRASATSWAIQEQDYIALFQEVQMLKMTIQEQVEAHKELIELQRNQQAFINEYLIRSDRNNGAMVRQAELLKQQYNSAVSQWEGFSGSPVHVSSPTRGQSPRCRGVGVWLESLGLKEYADVFAVNEIDFQSLSLLSEEDLVRMGIAALGPRKAILNGIAELRHQEVRASPKSRTRARRSQPPASRSPPPISPPKWTAHVDTTTSRVYYFNSHSGESRWDVPSKNDFSPETYVDML